MQKINAISTAMRRSHVTRRHYRLLVVGSSLIVVWNLLTGLLSAWLRLPFEFGEVVLFGLIALVSFVCQYRLYHLNATRIASVPEDEIDERQKMVRYGAYQRAYRLLYWIIVIGLPILLIPVFMYHTPFPSVLGSYLGLTWLITLLPTWIVAWTERDDVAG